jgi:hypothetical protein
VSEGAAIYIRVSTRTRRRRASVLACTMTGSPRCWPRSATWWEPTAELGATLSRWRIAEGPSRVGREPKRDATSGVSLHRCGINGKTPVIMS